MYAFRPDPCIKCGACVRACPVRATEGARAFPGPRRLAVEAARFGSIDQNLERTSFLCTTCQSCSSVCPSRIDIPEAMIQIRRGTMLKGQMSAGHGRLLHNIDMYGRAVERTGKAFRSPLTGRGPIYFPGCIGMERLPASCEAVFGLIVRGGNAPTVPEGLVCCGSPLEKIGELRERAEGLKMINLEILDDTEGLHDILSGMYGKVTRFVRSGSRCIFWNIYMRMLG